MTSATAALIASGRRERAVEVGHAVNRREHNEQSDVGRALRERAGRDHGGDQRLHRLRQAPGGQDIRGSLAHAAMLGATGILPAEDVAAIEARAQGRRGRDRKRLLRVLARARGHPHERREPARASSSARPPGGCTPRARATTRSRPTCGCGCATPSTRSTASSPTLQSALAEKALRFAGTVMPGFTHLQSAQPVTFGHHLLAYVEMLARDRGRFADARRRLERMPARRRCARRHLVPDRPRT